MVIIIQMIIELESYIYIVIKQKWSRPSNHQTSYSHKCKRFQKHGISQAGANDGDCFWPCSYEHL